MINPSLEIPDATKIPEGQLLDDELSGHIEKAILELPKKYRLVIVLRDMEGLTAEEAAKVLDISVSAVKSRLHRARLFVREEVGRIFIKPCHLLRESIGNNHDSLQRTI